MKKRILSSALALALLMGGLMGCAEEKKPVDQDVVLKVSQSEPVASGPSASTEPTEKVSEKPKPSVGTSKPSESAEPTEPTDPTAQPKPSEGTGTPGKPADGDGTSGNQGETTKPSNQGGTTKPSGGNETTTKPTASNPEPTEPKPAAHTHSYSATTVASTCTAEGYTKHTCSCGESYNDSQTAALGHSYTDAVVEATTSSEGYTEHTCSRCGDTYRDNYTPVIETTWVTEAEVAAICAEANAYAESIGFTIDPEFAQSWAAPMYTTWDRPQSKFTEDLHDRADGCWNLGWKYFYATYEADSEYPGHFIIYGMWG